jgi:hypothetical protein
MTTYPEGENAVGVAELKNGVRTDSSSRTVLPLRLRSSTLFESLRRFLFGIVVIEAARVRSAALALCQMCTVTKTKMSDRELCGGHQL